MNRYHVQNNATLLIVEDDREVAILMRDVLETYGYRCLVEYHGDQALDRAVMERPQLILLDIMLDGIDGYTICRRLKQHPQTQSTPVIFVSALQTDQDVLEARAAGGAYYIRKPFDLNHLHAKVKQALDGVRQAGLVSRRGRIMVVQSLATPNPTIAMLKTHGFDVITLSDPEETVRRAKIDLPDVILFDVEEEADLVQFIVQALRRERCTLSIPVICLALEVHRYSGPDFSAVRAVIQKPVSDQEVLTLLSDLIQPQSMIPLSASIPQSPDVSVSTI